MKKIMFIFISLMAAQAHALIVGGFGLDIDSMESAPSENSSQAASSLYNALNLEDEDGEKFIELNPSIFSCTKVTDVDAYCAFVSEGFISQNSSSMVFLDLELSKALYDALNVEEFVRVGASIKTIENLRCVKRAQRVPYRCILTNVEASEF